MDTLDKKSVDFACKLIDENHPLRVISILQAFTPTIAFKHLFNQEVEAPKTAEHKETKRKFMNK